MEATLKSIDGSLKRIAAAMEAGNAAMEGEFASQKAQDATVAKIAATVPETVDETKVVPMSEAKKLRVAVQARADKLGIAYTVKTGTGALLKKVEKAEKAATAATAAPVEVATTDTVQTSFPTNGLNFDEPAPTMPEPVKPVIVKEELSVEQTAHAIELARLFLEKFTPIKGEEASNAMIVKVLAHFKAPRISALKIVDYPAYVAVMKQNGIEA